MSGEKVDLDELERKARAATQGEWWISVDDGAICSGPEEPDAIEVGAMDLGVADTEHVLANNPPVTLALISYIRELEAVSAVAYDLTHEEGSLALQVGDAIDAEDIDKIERQAAALLQLGMLYRKGCVLP